MLCDNLRLYRNWTNTQLSKGVRMVQDAYLVLMVVPEIQISG